MGHFKHLDYLILEMTYSGYFKLTIGKSAPVNLLKLDKDYLLKGIKLLLFFCVALFFFVFLYDFQMSFIDFVFRVDTNKYFNYHMLHISFIQIDRLPFLKLHYLFE